MNLDDNMLIIGAKGFVGSSIARQCHSSTLLGRENFSDGFGKVFPITVCCAAPAQKWIANKNPDADLNNINELKNNLREIKTQEFILISTVDVFKIPFGVTEDTAVDETGLQPYGLHRRYLETFVESHFPRHLIVRLPGLVGPGLRKNVIFDFLNQNNLDAIESRGVFQFYPMVNLWYDIQTALQAQLSFVHLTAEPISVAEVAQHGFGREFQNTLANPLAQYDFQSKHAALFGGCGAYQYSKRETLLAIRAYAQSEPVTLKNAGMGQ